MSDVLNSMYKDILKEVNVTCTICKSKSPDDCFILPCSHVFHINCIVNSYINNIYENSLNDYIQNIKCITCETPLDIASIFYINSKYSNLLKSLIDNNVNTISNFENSISDLNTKINNIRYINEKINNRINTYTKLIHFILSK